MLQNEGIIVKRLNQTSWHTHYETVRVVQTHLEKLISTFEVLGNLIGSTDPSSSAYILLLDEWDLSFLSYLFILFEVLDEVNQTQTYLQSPRISLEQGTVKHQVLEWFLEGERPGTERSSVQQQSVRKWIFR